jgi:hypothetical protein
MKAIRLAVTALSLSALAGCDGVVDAPVPTAEETLSVPTAAAPVPDETITICSDPSRTELSYDGATWIPAFATGPQYAPYGTQIPGSTWVAPYPQAGIVSVPPGTFFFRTAFTLPADVKNATLSGLVHADNQATFFLNGVQFFQQQPVVAYANFQDPVDAFSTSRDLVAGLNVVRVQLVNGGTEPSTTALDFCYTVSYRLGGNNGNDRCPAAPSIAARYLQSRGLQPTSAEGRNIVTLVADHMTEGARFEGYDRCDAGYAPAVVAYVNARLP